MKKNKIMLAAMAGLIAGVAGLSAHGLSVPKAFGEEATDVADKHACKGLNACKGKCACKSDKNACKGQNACKGTCGCATDGSK